MAEEAVRTLRESLAAPTTPLVTPQWAPPPAGPNIISTGVAAAPTPPRSDVDALLATAEKMLRQQREKLLDTETQHGAHRQRIVDGYRVEMEKLRSRAEDELRDLDAAHAARVTGLQTVIGKLTALRGA